MGSSVGWGGVWGGVEKEEHEFAFSAQKHEGKFGVEKKKAEIRAHETHTGRDQFDAQANCPWPLGPLGHILHTLDPSSSPSSLWIRPKQKPSHKIPGEPKAQIGTIPREDPREREKQKKLRFAPPLPTSGLPHFGPTTPDAHASPIWRKKMAKNRLNSAVSAVLLAGCSQRGTWRTTQVSALHVRVQVFWNGDERDVERFVAGLEPVKELTEATRTLDVDTTLASPLTATVGAASMHDGARERRNQNS